MSRTLLLPVSAAVNGTGNALNNSITGNGAANILTGGLGNDTLNGGAGIDTLIGGAGNDTYVVDNAGDVVTELVGEGTDTVQASITYTLGATLENLTLTGSTAINGTGNDASNTLTGNSAANVLTGGLGNDSLNGGAGADTLVGGVGNDTYTVDNASDVTTELASEGTDLVNASITWTLAANVENLTLSGSTSINGTGNVANNVLTGNSATNVLTGGAGDDTLNGAAGADTLIGGAGNDSYTVDNAADTTTELAGEGTDGVSSSVTWTLAANFENLTLTGSSAVNGTGNSLANVITGNSGANVLSGDAGNDTLNDAAGANVFVGGAGNDTLNVTSTGIDRIALARGHGSDTIIGSGTAANDVLEVSNGITKAVMGLLKSGNDLVVDLGSGESVTLRNWYAGVRNVGTLKIIGDAAWVAGQAGTPTIVETFDLVAVAAQFDAARAADPLLTRWPLTSATAMMAPMSLAMLGSADTLRVAGATRVPSSTTGLTEKTALLRAQLAEPNTPAVLPAGEAPLQVSPSPDPEATDRFVHFDSLPAPLQLDEAPSQADVRADPPSESWAIGADAASTNVPGSAAGELTLRTATVAEVRNMRALLDFWQPAPSGTTAGNIDWLFAALDAQAVELGAPPMIVSGLADFHSEVGAEPTGANAPAPQIQICEGATGTGCIDGQAEAGPSVQPVARAAPPQRTASWWDEAAVREAVAPLVRHAATVTGWHAVADVASIAATQGVALADMPGVAASLKGGLMPTAATTESIGLRDAPFSSDTKFARFVALR